jgi:hypothetical protein
MMISCTAGASCGCGVQTSPSSELNMPTAVLLHATYRYLHIISAIQTLCSALTGMSVPHKS